MEFTMTAANIQTACARGIARGPALSRTRIGGGHHGEREWGWRVMWMLLQLPGPSLTTTCLEA